MLIAISSAFWVSRWSAMNRFDALTNQQADDIDIEVVDGLGDLTELRVLVFFLIAVQVQREDLQPGAAGQEKENLLKSVQETCEAGHFSTKTVPRKSLHPIHAPSTPVVVCPVIRHPTDLSQKGFTLLVSTTLASLRRVLEGFTFVRLSDAHLPKVFLELFLQRSPPRPFIAAAWSGLRPAPESRSRGAPSRPVEFHHEPLTEPYLILSHLTARPIAGRSQSSIECAGSSRCRLAQNSTAMSRSLRSTLITRASSLL